MLQAVDLQNSEDFEDLGVELLSIAPDVPEDSSRAILSSCGLRAEAISANEVEGRLCPSPLDPGPH